MAYVEITINNVERMCTLSMFVSPDSLSPFIRFLTTSDLHDETTIVIFRRIRDRNVQTGHMHLWYMARVSYEAVEGSNFTDARFVASMLFGDGQLDDLIPDVIVEREDKVIRCNKALLEDEDLDSLIRVVCRDREHAESSARCLEEFIERVQNGEDVATMLSLTSMRELARRHDILGGHWSIFLDQDPLDSDPDDRETIEDEKNEAAAELLHKLVISLASGPLARSTAYEIGMKQTPTGPVFWASNDCCQRVATDDPHPNETQVFGVRDALVQSNIDYNMAYKPDVYSACYVTRHNQNVVRPSIYRSYSSRFVNAQKTGQVEGV